MNVALTALEATIAHHRAQGRARPCPFGEFFLLPGNTPQRENVLEPGDLITHCDPARGHGEQKQRLPEAARSRFV